ncbi:DUF2255 family protein [Spongiactinospora sp. TRM90649]|uniref:DUF2255 family protein n=1 Tax=Spongiactinospora sp. TRM90649 TaxID=3031114 RepID=UPI0023F8E997|nr:DUF2255 family protein [Spongiactinospora sp. TRM90649]MDF5756408.1 DUF2255 family protein [Spongiactinospora sp. TRM90649]
MSDWTKDQLDGIGAADELHVAPAEKDGTTRHEVPIWVVRVDDDLFARSYRGHDGKWYRAAVTTHRGHVQADGIEADVTFTEETDPGLNERIDDAYRAKYGHYSPDYVDPMIAGPARETTLKLLPR